MPLRGRKQEPIGDEDTLYEYAVGALARRMRTTAELTRLLRGRVARGEAGDALIEAVLRRLHEREYLSDTRYAAVYSASRRENARLGPRRIERDLQARGVPREVIRAQVDAAF